MTICVYPTDADWISNLEAHHVQNNVNFWRGDTRTLHLAPGSCFYFKVRGSMKIAGRGYFRSQETMTIEDAWKRFGLGNGVMNAEELTERARRVLKVEGDSINCLILDGVEILTLDKRPEISVADFPKNIMGSKNFEDDQLQYVVAAFQKPKLDPLSLIGENLAVQPEFDPTDITSSRQSTLRSVSIRQGQGSFRSKLLEAYQNCCCITGESEMATLEAAHIHPYRGKETNDVQNGLLLRSDWHTLFDLGYWTIDESLTVVVSSLLTSRYYRGFAGKTAILPELTKHRPSKSALRFHRENIFRN